jgi:hypothetical protein
MQSQVIDAQRAAVQDVRARYERGELSFEAFRRVIDALLLAQSTEECQAILAELPRADVSALAALDPAPVSPAPAGAEQGSRWKWVVAFIGEAKKMRRPWRLAAETLATALVGEVKMDLTLAALPPRAVIRAAAIVGEVTLYVPRTARVTMRGVALVGEINALGEKSGGIVGFAHEEHVPDSPAETTLEIEALALVGEVKVVLVDGPVLGAARSPRARLLPQAE